MGRSTRERNNKPKRDLYCMGGGEDGTKCFRGGPGRLRGRRMHRRGVTSQIGSILLSLFLADCSSTVIQAPVNIFGCWRGIRVGTHLDKQTPNLKLETCTNRPTGFHVITCTCTVMSTASNSNLIRLILRSRAASLVPFWCSHPVLFWAHRSLRLNLPKDRKIRQQVCLLHK